MEKMMNKPNIIWFMFDSLRNEFLNEFGCDTERTFLDELLSQGVSFTNCHGTAPFTIVSMASKMTGCYPSLNYLDGWLKKDPTRTLNPKCLSLPEILRYNGYYTCYISSSDSCTYVNPHGFDFYYAERGYENFPLNAYIEQLGPKFVFIDFGDLHDYCCQKSFDCTRKDFIYGIKNTVEKIQEFYCKIKSDNDLIILTSDHGMRTNTDFVGNKYADESVTGRYLTEATTRNSFNLIWKGYLKPQKIDRMCRGVDMFPTILDILGMDYPRLDGISLKPLLYGSDVPINYSYSLTGWSVTHPMKPGVWCVRDKQYKLVITEKVKGIHREITKELFDYKNDREESKDLSDTLPEKFLELEGEAKRMFFSKRVIDNYYSYQGFDINTYLNFRSQHKNDKALSFAKNIIKNNWQKKCRKNFLIRYYKNRIINILYWNVNPLFRFLYGIGFFRSSDDYK